MKSPLFHRIKQDQAPEILNCIIEISKGDFNKYEFDHELGVLKLDRVLYGPNFYPVDYADVPGTWNKYDKDPLDAVVFSTKPIHPGVVVEGRVVGMADVIDCDEIDHKIICVNNVDPRFNYVKTYEDLPEWSLKDLRTFFETYKYAQKGPDAVKVNGFVGPEEAYKFINECKEEYKKKFAKEIEQ